MRRKIYKFYRRAMRTLARFILGFETCPVDYRKSYGNILRNILCAFALSSATVAVFGVLLIYVA